MPEKKETLAALLTACDDVVETAAHSFKICRSGHVGGGFDPDYCCKIGKLVAALAEYRKPRICLGCKGTRKHVCTFDCQDPCEQKNGPCYRCDGSGKEES